MTRNNDSCRSLTADRCLMKRALLDAVSIENWILPAAFVGVLDRVVWVRPPWAEQIPDGEHHFHIGRERSTGMVRITCTESYFINEGEKNRTLW